MRKKTYSRLSQNMKWARPNGTGFFQNQLRYLVGHIWTKGEAGARLNRFKPSSKVFLLTVPRRCFFCGSFMFFLSCFVMLSCTSNCWCLVVTYWGRADLSLVCDVYCDVVTFPLVSWVRSGTWLYWFLIFTLFLTLSSCDFLVICIKTQPYTTVVHG